MKLRPSLYKAYTSLSLPWLLSSLLLVCLIILSPAVHPARAESKKPNFFFILWDALRADRVGANGSSKPTTPNMDKLAADGVLFRRHYANGTTTSISLPQIFSGQYRVISRITWMAHWDDVIKSPPPGFSLFPADLKKEGYKNILISTHLGIRSFWLEGAFDEQYYIPSNSENYASAEEAMKILSDVLAKPHDKPLFFYIHLMETHFPHPPNKHLPLFFKHPNFRSKIMNKAGNPHKEQGVKLSKMEKKYLNALYDCNTRLADESMKTFADVLKKHNLYKNSHILVTADHGDLLGEGQENHYIGHSAYPWESQVHVPLIWKLPENKLAGTQVKFATSHLDLKPTILAVTGARKALKTKNYDGMPLFKKEQVIKKPRRVIMLERGLFVDGYKYLSKYLSSMQSNNIRMFDLEKDPNEQDDLLARYFPPSTGKKEYVHPRYPFFMFFHAPELKPESGRILNRCGEAGFSLFPKDMKKTQDWTDGKWTLRYNWMWVSPQEDAGVSTWRIRFKHKNIKQGDRTTYFMDGKYLVHVIMADAPPYSSSLEFRIGQGPWVKATTKDYQKRKIAQVGSKPLLELGIMEIKNSEGALSIRQMPGDSFALIYALRFVPLASKDKGQMVLTPKEEAERIKQLKNLGYIQ